MNVEFIERIGMLMPEETHTLFLVALKHKLSTLKTSQTELADAVGCSPQHLNAVINERVNERGRVIRASDKLQRKIAEAYNCGHMDFLALGQRLLDGLKEEEISPENQTQQTNISNKLPSEYMTYDQMIAATRQVEDTFRNFQDCWRKMEDRIKLWRAVFDYLPIPALLIKDGVVIFQNQKSLEWGKATGRPLCESCIDAKCNGTRDACAIKQAIENGIVTNEIRIFNGMKYLIDVMPLHQNQNDYFLVSAAVVAE